MLDFPSMLIISFHFNFESRPKFIDFDPALVSSEFTDKCISIISNASTVSATAATTTDLTATAAISFHTTPGRNFLPACKQSSVAGTYFPWSSTPACHWYHPSDSLYAIIYTWPRERPAIYNARNEYDRQSCNREQNSRTPEAV